MFAPMLAVMAVAASVTGAISTLDVSGRLTEQAVREVIASHLSDMAYDCSIGGLAAVTARVDLRIDRRGWPSNVRVAGLDPTPARCLRRALLALRFPAVAGTTRVRGDLLFANAKHDHGTGARVVPGGNIQIGKVVARGELDVAIVRRVVRAGFAGIRACYDTDAAISAVASRVVAQFTIDPDGAVSRIGITGSANRSHETCLASVFRALHFPAPDSGHVNVTYPLNFRPASSTR